MRPKKRQDCNNKAQPNRPGQVFGYPGNGVRLQRYTLTTELPMSAIKVIKQIDNVWMEVVYESDNIARELSTADFGMIPYDSGVWNQSNWVILA